MTTIAAREAKTRFGELLDNARHGPVTIEKHGRRVAEYDELMTMKKQQLLAAIEVGLQQLDRGEGKEYDEDGLDALAECIKQAGDTPAKS